MENLSIFTEIFNCGKIGRIMLESFHKYHDMEINIFGTTKDFDDLGEIKDHKNNVLIETNFDGVDNPFKNGHLGTSLIFATALSPEKGKYVIHIDSDVYFKKESISLITNAFNEGYDVIGSRRCFGNNPSGVKGLENYPDTISTYFMGVNTEKIPEYDIAYFANMCQGVIHPLKYPILDFFDPVTHAIIDNGGKIKYLESDLVGSQNEQGKKTNKFISNLHFDCGEHLVHFGGVGSGYSVYNKMSSPEKSYAEWSLGRYSLFAKLFYNEDTGCNAPTVYTEDGRWGNGNYDQSILEQVKKDMS